MASSKATDAVEAVKALKRSIVEMNPRDLALLETNARFMRHEQFQQLVANVRKDGGLTSVPLVAIMDDGRYEVLSGNHRVQAAVEVGLESIHVMTIDEPLTHEQRVALQLSHNAIVGEDDPATLKALYEQLDSIDWRDYAGLDDKTLNLLDSVQPASMGEANLEFQSLSIIFLPEELEHLEAAVKTAMAISRSSDSTWIARYSAHQRLLDALADVGKSYDVMNVATGLDLILDVFDRHKDEIVEGWWAGPDNPLRHTKWVPMSPVVGLNAPAEELSLIRRAIEKARGGDTGMQSWQALHRIAERYLGRGEDAQPAAPAETPQSQGPTFSDQEMPSS